MSKHTDQKVKGAKPFVKWAGGKTQIMYEINKHLPKDVITGKIKRYVEPFVGGGSTLLNFLRHYKAEEIYISDLNIDLVNTYEVVRDFPRELVEALGLFRDVYISKDFYDKEDYSYGVREDFNNGLNSELTYMWDKVLRASQFIFLNKTCYNGLWRVNKLGEFNSSFGKYDGRSILDKNNIMKVSKLLQRVNILSGDFYNTIQ